MSLCIAFMALMQFPAVKAMPCIVSNAMALLTCFPGAIAVLAFGMAARKVFENRTLANAGMLSYEIYLVHAFTLDLIISGVVALIIFMVATVALAGILLNLHISSN